MKRELGAGLLLLALLGASLGNLAYFDGLTGRIEAELALSRSAAEQGDYDRALAHCRKAEAIWNGAGTYLNIFIRHPEVDSTADAFCDLRGTLDEEDSASCPAAFDKLLYHLDCLNRMEHPGPGSVF